MQLQHIRPSKIAQYTVICYSIFMEQRIGWLRPVAPPENVIVDASGNEVILTPEELTFIKSYERNEVESLKDLIIWGGFKTLEEVEAFLASEADLSS